MGAPIQARQYGAKATFHFPSSSLRLAAGHGMAAQNDTKGSPGRSSNQRFHLTGPGNRPADDTGSSCSTPLQVEVARYRWRASNIPTPWDGHRGSPGCPSDTGTVERRCAETRSFGAEGRAGRDGPGEIPEPAAPRSRPLHHRRVSNRSAIGTLVDRASRFTILVHLPGRRGY